MGRELPRWISISPRRQSRRLHPTAWRFGCGGVASGSDANGILGCGLDFGHFGFVIYDPRLVELPVKFTLELLATFHQVDSPEELLVHAQSVCRRFA